MTRSQKRFSSRGTGPGNDSGAARLDSTRSDIARLPACLSTAAVVYDVGEAEWPAEMVEDVVRGLVGMGRVVQVVERSPYDGDRLVEKGPVSTYEGTDRDANLRFILMGLPLPDGTRAVISWLPGQLV